MEPESLRTAFNGKLIRVDVEHWPTGVREVVHHPGAAAIVAITASDRVVLVRQLREAVRRRLLEIPAGILDVEGEDPAVSAARELLEETGYQVAAVKPLGSILTSPGFADERIELFLGEAAERLAVPREEGLEVVLTPFGDDRCCRSSRRHRGCQDGGGPAAGEGAVLARRPEFNVTPCASPRGCGFERTSF